MYARSVRCVRAFSGQLRYLPLSRRIEAVHKTRMDATRLLHYPDFAHHFGVCDSAVSVADALLGVA